MTTQELLSLARNHPHSSKFHIFTSFGTREISYSEGLMLAIEQTAVSSDREIFRSRFPLMVSNGSRNLSADINTNVFSFEFHHSTSFSMLYPDSRRFGSGLLPSFLSISQGNRRCPEKPNHDDSGTQLIWIFRLRLVASLSPFSTNGINGLLLQNNGKELEFPIEFLQTLSSPSTCFGHHEKFYVVARTAADSCNSGQT
ncbi:hypothetical protein L5515_017261 [Caenorhabditis briggsae]|uniref:Uncharacterized protein n=1 Tax=Caenorhabditis briggsae TaxID=6238 RepID=A0AAE9FDD0_CAEBR|nr:hypothetical protein L5515_017261 [Caenorhabditis briggsae]